MTFVNTLFIFAPDNLTQKHDKMTVKKKSGGNEPYRVIVDGKTFKVRTRTAVTKLAKTSKTCHVLKGAVTVALKKGVKLTWL